MTSNRVEVLDKMKNTCPQSWAIAQLGELVTEVRQIDPKKDLSGRFLYIDIGCIDNSSFRIARAIHLEASNSPSRARQLVELNDVLVSTVRTYLKNVALVDESHQGAVASSGFCVLRAANGLNPNWIYYYVLSDKFLESLNEFQRGSSYPAVRNTDVLERAIPFPPLPEQRRIVAKIEALFSELDKGIEQLKAAKEQLKVYRQAVLKAAFEGKLTEGWRRDRSKEDGVRSKRGANGVEAQSAHELLARIRQEREAQAKTTGRKLKPVPPLTDKELAELPKLPEGWAWGRLLELTTVVSDGDHLPPPKSDKGIPFVTISNIDRGTIDFSKTMHVRSDYYKGLKVERRPQKGDILYTVTGSFGIPVLVDFDTEFCFQRHIGLVRPRDSIGQRWLFYALSSPQLFRQAEDEATGTAQKTVSLGSLRNLLVPLCSCDEQDQITKEIESRLDECDKLECNIKFGLSQSESLRQGILKVAFEGRLVEQDPNDPPASALLERIQEEKGRRDQEMRGQKAKRLRRAGPPASLLPGGIREERAARSAEGGSKRTAGRNSTRLNIGRKPKERRKKRQSTKRQVG